MIAIKNLSLRLGTKVLFEDASATIFAGEKVGLVGRNGIGKSSLFSLLAGRLHEDEGSFDLPSHWRIAEVMQNMPENTQSATDFVIAGDRRLMRARQSLQQAEAHAQTNDDWSAIGEAHTALADAGEYQAQARAQTLLLGLGFSVKEVAQAVNSFSGGWRMRLQLARTLMDTSDLMLLDEPTNHLDLDALVWLEGYLQRFEGTMIVISHDREFLDAVTKTTVHIERGKLYRYGTNYSGFETIRAEKLALQMAQFDKQQKVITHFQNFIDRFKAKATKARQAQSRIKALERMEKIAPVVTEAEFSFEFREAEKIPNPLLTVEDGVFGYQSPQDDIPILDAMNQTLLSGQRIGLLGANGRGKSTWIKTIAGALPLLSGTVRKGKGLSIGYFAQQEMEILQPDQNPLQHLRKLVKLHNQNERDVDLRSFLGTFNFSGDMAHQPVGKMSGGEKARLALALIVWQSPNLLLLDEPTNHLDLTTREALSMAINSFEGTVILVSHDRALLRTVCDEFWLVADGVIRDFEGDVDDYQQYLLAQAKLRKGEEKSTKTTQKMNAVATPNTKRSSTDAQALKKLQKEIMLIEKNIAKLEQEQKVLSYAALTNTDTEARKAHGIKLKNVTETLAAEEALWFEKQHTLENFQQSIRVMKH